jgi:hypothetical protein
MQVTDRTCDPGVQGCVLDGRFMFSRADRHSAVLLRRERRRPNDTRTED